MNYYALEPILLKRLRDACPSLADIQGAPDLWAIRELSQNALATTAPHHPLNNPTGQKHGGAYLTFWGEDVAEARRDCDRAHQTWLVAVCAKKHQSMKTGVEARQEDGALVDQVLTALRGWDYASLLPAPHNGGRRFLKRVTSPVNRHQMSDPLAQDNGLTTTLLAYQASDIII
jgi:hypothetical protein